MFALKYAYLKHGVKTPMNGIILRKIMRGP
jgi:hypothetical protein